MNNKQSYFDSPIFKNLDDFAKMFEKSLRKNDSVDNSDDRTEKDYDPIDLMPIGDLEDSRNL